jgi:hypothetical protein
MFLDPMPVTAVREIHYPNVLNTRLNTRLTCTFRPRVMCGLGAQILGWLLNLEVFLKVIFTRCLDEVVI